MLNNTRQQQSNLPNLSAQVNVHPIDKRNKDNLKTDKMSVEANTTSSTASRTSSLRG